MDNFNVSLKCKLNLISWSCLSSKIEAKGP